MLLQLSGVQAYYGKSHILHGVDMNVGQGEIVSLLGRNGSGRSTTVRTIMGLVHGEGSIKFQGDEVLGHHAFDIALVAGAVLLMLYLVLRRSSSRLKPRG